jgi:hypothetical protein
MKSEPVADRNRDSPPAVVCDHAENAAVTLCCLALKFDDNLWDITEELLSWVEINGCVYRRVPAQARSLHGGTDGHPGRGIEQAGKDDGDPPV